MVQFWQFINDIKSIIIMVIVQIAFAGVNITYKLAAVDGMNLRVLVAYRILFAAVFMVPIAYFLESGALVHNLFLESLVLTSATINAAMLNLIPAVTFILAVFFRLEKVSLKTLPGTAKVMGTVLGILGAMVLTLYKGFEIKIGSPNTHLMKGAAHGHGPGVHDARDHLIGSVFAVCGCCCYASWLIVQAKMSINYPCPYSCTVLSSRVRVVHGSRLEVLEVGLEHSTSHHCCVMVTLVAWCIRLKGPLFVSIFNPLRVIIVAFAGYLFLDEKLYLGSVLGAILIVIGLYGVVWGKGKEIKKKAKLVPSINCEDSTKDIEIITSSVLDEGNKASKDNVMNNASTRPKCAAKEDDDHSLPNDDIVVDAQGKSKRVDGIS
uniref:WAT1-related protein n=1 Tax=Chenopodium quinoa TaxID=63459 RepID=A0A803MX76_CHEQI